VAGNSTSLTLSDEPIAPLATPTTHRTKVLLAALLVAVDGLMLLLGFFAGYVARMELPFFARPETQPALLSYGAIILLQTLTIIVLFYFSRLYHQQRAFSRVDQMRNIIGVVTLGVLLTNGLQELLFRNSILDVAYPRSMFFYVWFFSMAMTILGREFHRWLSIRVRLRGLANDNLLIIGSGKTARDLVGRIKNSPELGYRMIGVVTSREDHQGRMMGLQVLGNYPDDVVDVIDRYQIDQVIIALSEPRPELLIDLIRRCQRGQVDLKIYPDMFVYMVGDLNVDELGDTPLLTVRDIALRGWKLSLKRSLDIFGAMVGLVFLSPLFLLTAVLMKLESKGTVFFTQERIGMDGRPFPMIKFRSMRPDSEAHGPGWTTPDDTRITRIGKFMRRTSWDEIPQLINVLMGHMSLVGPRPEQPSFVKQFSEQYPRYMERHREMVGMTGWAQVHGLRGDTSIKDRIAYDLWYVEHWSLWLDIKIIFRTVLQTLLRKSDNAY
jgi:exopolysaccharide biosynthesis polyprenyl glycosylphosphotransferase